MSAALQVPAQEINKGQELLGKVLLGAPDAFPEDAPGLEPVIDRDLWQLHPIAAVPRERRSPVFLACVARDRRLDHFAV